MEAALFAKMMSDKSVTDLKKLGYKYPQADIAEFIGLLKTGFYTTLPMKDFNGEPLVYLESVAQVHLSAAKILLTPHNSSQHYGIKAMEDEIVSTLTIEQIDTSRDSVRRILTGYAPASETENRIYGMKKGVEFIADPNHRITEENLHQLYEMTVGDFLADLIAYANAEGSDNDLLKAALLHFYIAYLHPYFDGNGRMARLLHLWYLVQQGYSSALFIPLSRYVEKSRRGYYDAYTLTEQNARISGVLDVTPFLVYFIEHVYHQLEDVASSASAIGAFQTVLERGGITEKEKDLWHFVLSAYGNGEFSTKQLERDFGNAAYATILSFVLKFEKLGLLQSQKYGNRVKYSLRQCG